MDILFAQKLFSNLNEFNFKGSVIWGPLDKKHNKRIKLMQVEST